MNSGIGVIRMDEAYSLDEFKRRMKLQDAAWWTLRDRGLRFAKVGTRYYVLGRDVIAMLDEIAVASPVRPGKRRRSQ